MKFVFNFFTITAALILFFTENCTAYLKLWKWGYSLHEHSGDVSSCRNLPQQFKQKTYNAETNQCIVLYSKENCEGTSYLLYSGYHPKMFSFTNRTVSYEACSSVGLSANELEPEISFYDEVGIDDNTYIMPYKKIPSTCQNLNSAFVQWSVSSLKTKKCVQLYSEENCKGESKRVSPGYVRDLGSFKEKTKSFAPCNAGKSLDATETHVKFYRKPDFTGIVYDVNLQPGCNNDIYLELPVSSIDLPVCVKLYEDYGCTGTSVKILPDKYAPHRHPVLPIEPFQIKSLEECEEKAPTTTPAPVLNETAVIDETGGIAFYDNSYFKSILFRTKLTGSCQVFPSQFKNKVESVKTEACVILFPTESCDVIDEANENVGFTLKVLPNGGRTLPYFSNVAKAFQSCEGYKGGASKIGHVQFFKGSEGPLLDVPLTSGCADLPNSHSGKVSSVASNHCVVLFSEVQCQGRNFSVRPFSGMRLKDHFDKETASFKACSDLPDWGVGGNTEELGRTKFYANENYTSLLLDSPVLGSCVNLRSKIWGKMASVKTTSCVILFNQQNCQGSSFHLEPEGIPDFDFSVKSFVTCEQENGGEGDEEESFNELKKKHALQEVILKQICSATKHQLCSILGISSPIV